MKLAYYRDHHWERVWIDAATDQITTLYRTRYAPPPENVEPEPEETDNFKAHVFKRGRVVKVDELTAYLNSGCATPRTNVLQWWKVCFF